MFGQQNNNQASDQIPDQSIDGVLNHTNDGNDWQHPGAPLNNTPAAAQTVTPASAAPADPAVSTVPAVATDTSVVSQPAASVPHDLIDIKQQALQQLSPLVGHLEQSPEEKFRTTMMMIQASDDQSLIQTAYDAAQQITDEKAKAQALLDIVNEINYFTAQHQG